MKDMAHRPVVTPRIWIGMGFAIAVELVVFLVLLFVVPALLYLLAS